VAVLRQLDLAVLALALPVFLLADLPLAGYLAGAGAWLAQKAVQALANRRAAASSDPRTVVGLLAGSMVARGWLVALVVFAVGMTTERRAGLTAAVMVIVLFTVYFTISMILRPFAASERRR
jgi:hypothetical protein